MNVCVRVYIFIYIYICIYIYIYHIYNIKTDRIPGRIWTYPTAWQRAFEQEPGIAMSCLCQEVHAARLRDSKRLLCCSRLCPSFFGVMMCRHEWEHDVCVRVERWVCILCICACTLSSWLILDWKAMYLFLWLHTQNTTHLSAKNMADVAYSKRWRFTSLSYTSCHRAKKQQIVSRTQEIGIIYIYIYIPRKHQRMLETDKWFHLCLSMYAISNDSKRKALVEFDGQTALVVSVLSVCLGANWLLLYFF